MAQIKHALISDDVQPVSQEELARFRDQFTSVLLKRFLKTIELQRAQIVKQNEQITTLLKEQSAAPIKRAR